MFTHRNLVRACRMAVVAGALACALPAAANAAPPSYYPFGPQTNVARAAVPGWKVCFTQGYEDTAALSTVLDACSGDYLMLAASETGSDTYELLAAAPREDVLFDTGEQDETTTRDANGSSWYFSENWSWGFAPVGAGVTKSRCDYLDGAGRSDGAQRLCWHTMSGELFSGYRAGVKQSTDTDLTRYVLEPFVATGPAVIAFGEQAQNTVSAARSVTFTLGASKADLGALEIAGTDADDFWLVRDTCAAAIIADAATCTATVRFVPSVKGNRTAQLRFANGDTLGADSTSLTGTAGDLPTGLPGAPGADGADGADGTNGTNGTNGADGTDGTKGADGADGSSGADGVDGVGGANGAGGANGLDGAKGADGAAGPAGMVGRAGTDGRLGRPGSRGPKGTSGRRKLPVLVRCARSKNGKRATCTFTAKVTRDTRVLVRDTRGTLASTRGQGTRTVTVTLKRKAHGKTRVVLAPVTARVFETSDQLVLSGPAITTSRP